MQYLTSQLTRKESWLPVGVLKFGRGEAVGTGEWDVDIYWRASPLTKEATETQVKRVA